MESPYVLFILGFLQLIIVGLGAWTLATTIRLQVRVTKVETLLEASILTDIKNLKDRMAAIETSHFKKP